MGKFSLNYFLILLSFIPLNINTLIQSYIRQAFLKTRYHAVFLRFTIFLFSF